MNYVLIHNESLDKFEKLFQSEGIPFARNDFSNVLFFDSSETADEIYNMISESVNFGETERFVISEISENNTNGLLGRETWVTLSTGRVNA